MDEMRYTRDQIEELTPNEIGQFISTTARETLHCLDLQDRRLKRPPIGPHRLKMLTSIKKYAMT